MSEGTPMSVLRFNQIVHTVLTSNIDKRGITNEMVPLYSEDLQLVFEVLPICAAFSRTRHGIKAARLFNQWRTNYRRKPPKNTRAAALRLCKFWLLAHDADVWVGRI